MSASDSETPAAAAAPAAEPAKAQAAPEYFDPLPHCGGYEEHAREANRVFVMPELFDGASFELKKPINMAPQFVTSHSVTLGKTVGAGAEEGSEKYMFGASFVGGDGTLVLISNMDTSGVLRAHMIKQFSPAFVTKVQAIVSSTPGASMVNGDVEHKGSDYAAQFKFVNDQALFFSYMQKVTPELAFGSQIEWYRARQMSVLSVAARYANTESVSTVRLNSNKDLSLSHMQQVTPSFAMATQVDYSLSSRESAFKLGYEYVLQSGRFRGQVGSDGKVGMLVQQSLIFGITLSLSGMADHKAKANGFKFGIGLAIGS